MMTANPIQKNVVSSLTPESVFEALTMKGMWTRYRGEQWLVWRPFKWDKDTLPYAVDDGKAARHEAKKFASIEDAFMAFPKLRDYCEQEAAKPTWQDHFRAALVCAADVAGCDVNGLCWESATLDNTWGDLRGLVFWGAPEACCKRAAEFFVAWVSKNGAQFKLFGGYEHQRAVRAEGIRYYSRFANGAFGWHRSPYTKSYEGASDPVETRVGYAAAYVYYPCAE